MLRSIDVIEQSQVSEDKRQLVEKLHIDRDPTPEQVPSEETRPRTALRRWAALVAVVVPLMAASWYLGTRMGPDAQSAQAPDGARQVGPELAVVRAANASAGSGPAEGILDASGYIVARREATVSASRIGKLESISVEEGDTVEKGDVIARLDSSTERAELSISKAQLRAARSAMEEIKIRLEEAERTHERIKELARAGQTSESRLDEVKYNVEALKAQLEDRRIEIEVSRQRVRRNEEALKQTKVLAPFSGVVTDVSAEVGEIVSPSSSGGGFVRTGICTLTDRNSLEAEIKVNEKYLHKVEKGQPVIVGIKAYPELELSGRVGDIRPVVERETAAVVVRVAIPDMDPRVLPNMAVDAEFRRADSRKGKDEVRASGEKELIVPRAALRGTDGEHYVYVRINDQRVKRKVVLAGRGDRNAIRVTGNLQEGDRVIVD